MATEENDEPVADAAPEVNDKVGGGTEPANLAAEEVIQQNLPKHEKSEGSAQKDENLIVKV